MIFEVMLQTIYSDITPDYIWEDIPDDDIMIMMLVIVMVMVVMVVIFETESLNNWA